MKKFTKQFMELSLIFAAVNSIGFAKAFAQDLDYREINSRNATISSSQSDKGDNKITEFLFAKDFHKYSLPKNRKLTDSEKDQKKLLKCVTKFIDKRKGLYDGPAIINKILSQAMDSDKLTADSYTLDSTTEKCWDAYNNLTNFSQSEIKKERLESALSNLPSSALAEKKTASFVKSQYQNSFTCIATEISASAALVLGASVGASSLKCLNSSGVIRNYIGPKIEFIGGFGAKVEYAKMQNFDSFTSGAIAGSSGSAPLNDLDNTILGAGAAGNTMYAGRYSTYQKEAQMIGLGLMTSGSYATLNVRVFNGPRNWGFVIDQLK